MFVRRRFPGPAGDEHNDVLRFAAGVIGLVFAFFIGFVVSALWGQIHAADGRVRAEGASGVELAGRAHVFGEPGSDRLRAALLQYEEAAVIFVTAALLLGCAIIYGVEKPATHYLMVAILGVLVGAIFYLVLMLAHPFLGDIATSSEPLHEVVRVLSPPP